MFANVIRVSTPNNYEACQIALAASMLLRRKMSDQLPVVRVVLFSTSVLILFSTGRFEIFTGENQGNS